MTMKNSFVLFDFDGVIVNTLDISYGASVAVSDYEQPLEMYKGFFEGNIFEEVEKKNAGDTNEEKQRQFYEIYSKGMILVDPVPGIIDVLNELHKRYTMIIVSSSINAPIHAYLEKHGLTEHFDWVMGADVHRSKVKKIEMVFEKYAIGPEQCVFVTDTLGDMREAEKKFVPSIGVTWGFHERERLEKGAAFAIVDNPERLLATIDEHFAKLA